MITTEDLRKFSSMVSDNGSFFGMNSALALFDYLIGISEAEDKARSKEDYDKEKMLEYGYDSLVFRYKEARFKNVEVERKNLMAEGKDPERAKKMAERDFLRFCQILLEIITRLKEGEEDATD